ncbi:adenylate/guanylate cyclase domain-containing protein [Desulfobacterales bacterium HSG16]|nr:adenylate/guanylate cyclase domain-containing protein [Desulfobacterales bacterium HSG16]
MPESRYLKKTAFFVCTSIILLSIFFTLSELHIPVVSYVESKSRDLRFLIRGIRKPGGEVVIVAIDDRSIDAVGRWPWPRFALAELISLLHKGGAESIAVDLLLLEPEENPELARIRELVSLYPQLGLLGQGKNSQVFFSNLVEAARLSDNDGLLAESIQEAGNVVLSMAFHESKKSLPIPVLAKVAAGIGFVNAFPDSDGIMRKGAAAITSMGTLFFSLPVRAAQQHLNQGKNKISFDSQDVLKIEGKHVPVNRNKEYLINYYGPNGTIKYYSFADVLVGNIALETFKGKSVFIGGAATGLGDHWPNPFTSQFWGVETQATIADNILSEQWLCRPLWLKYVEALLMGMLGIALCICFFRVYILWCLPIVLFSIILTACLGQYMFNTYRYVILYSIPMLEIFFLGLSISFFRYLTEGREKRILKAAFSQYLNPSVIHRIIKHPESLSLGGEKKELSVLFSDIRGFTNISERLSPENLVGFMNIYLTMMTDILQENEGTLDKYIGDAVMVIYGAPDEQKDHALRVCHTALKMIDALDRHQEKWKQMGLPPILAGIGINTGDMIVGNIGSKKRFNYTVMGDHVNLASRLEGMSKLYGVPIIVSEYTKIQTEKEFVFRELDFVRVKGKKQPVTIFELFGFQDESSKPPDFISAFQSGIGAYRKGKWHEAVSWFEQTLCMKSDDYPSKLFIKRCEDMKNMSFDANWDGVYIAKEK